MTVQSKSVIKSYFETGDRPTQQQFIDFIDSYQDSNTNLTLIASASVGVQGLKILGTATTAAAQQALGASSIGINVFQAITTAVAQQSIGGGTVGRQIFECATSASASTIIGSVIASASTTQYGITRIATSAETRAGLAVDISVSPGGMKDSLGFSNTFRSGSLAITAGANITAAHGFGSTPYFYMAEIVCDVANVGYSTGERLNVSCISGQDTSGAGIGGNVYVNNATIGYQVGSTAIIIPQKATGTSMAITLADWHIELTAWK